MALVEIENLSYSYPESSEEALQGMSLSIDEGEFLVIVGSSGSGKSTLCRCFNGLVPHFYGGKISGRVRVCGLDVSESPVKEMALKVGMVFQDPESQLVQNRVESEMAFGLENLGMDSPLIRKRVEEMMTALRISDIRNSNTGEISGGQKQKVALASVLTMHPELVVMDEPTSQLDPISAEDFLGIAKSINQDLGLTVVIVEHRLERCLHVADRVVVMKEGRISFMGTPEEVAAWGGGREDIPLPPITRLFVHTGMKTTPATVKEARRELMELAGEEEELSVRVGAAVEKVDGKTGSGYGVVTGTQEPKAFRRPGLFFGRAGSRRGKKAGSFERDEPAVLVERLHYIYPGGVEALRGVDLSIMPGEMLVIMGENGSGKSTLVKHFNGLLQPSRGSVRVNGVDSARVEVARLARHCAILGQNPNHHLLADTVEEELRNTLKGVGVERSRYEELIGNALGEMGIEELSCCCPRDLSCGEKQRVALAAVTVHEPSVLVLDEPTRGMDYSLKRELVNYLKGLSDSGVTVVVVTHDMELAADLGGKVVLMAEGRIISDGDSREILGGSLFFTSQFNKLFRGLQDDVVTWGDAVSAIERLR